MYHKIFLMLCLITSAVFSQNSKTLQGKVVDSKGNPIEDVSIIIESMGKGSYTDASGRFVFENVPNKPLKVKAYKLGYNSLTKEVAPNQTTVMFTLSYKSETLREVLVDGKVPSKIKQKVTTNRLGVKSIDMPSSSDVISMKLIDDQQALTLGGVMANVSGVYQFNKGYGGVSETFGARGISQRYVGFMFRDGTRFGTRQYLATPDLRFYQNIEILKGAAAINFGTISPGATINYVTKKPFFETKGNITLRYGSYNYIKPTLDYSFKLSDRLALRLVSTTDIGDSFRDDVSIERFSNFLALRYLANSSTTFDFNMDYQTDTRPIDFGLPIFEDRIITGTKVNADGKTVPVYLQETGVQRLYSKVTKDIRSRNIGGHYNNRTSNQLNANFKINSQLNDNWTLDVALGTSLSDYDYVHSGSGFNNVYFLEGNDLKIQRTLDQEEWSENTYGGQINLKGKYKLFGSHNTSSISVDYDNRLQKTTDYNQKPKFDEVYLFNRNTPKKDAVELDKKYMAETKYTGFGVAFQNLLSITNHIKFLAAIRMDAIEGNDQKIYINDVLNRSGVVDIEKGSIVTSQFDDVAFSPTLGLTVKLTETNALFASYTHTFNPNTRTQLDDNDEVLPSYYTDQFEIGTKNSFFNNKLDLMATYFIINDEGYVTSLTRPDRSEIGPGTEYKGLEFDLAAYPVKGLSLSTNYTYIDAMYNKGGYFKEGTRPQQTPEHQVGFLARYQFEEGALKGLSIGFDGQYTDERLGNDFYRGNNPYIQKAYTMLNAAIGYRYKNVDINARVTNLSDEFVFFAYRYGSVNPIDPRQFSITTRFKF